MHPALDLKRLTPSLQRASKVLLARKNGGYVKDRHGQPLRMMGLASAFTPMLPVFFENINPEGIPTQEEIDSIQAAGNAIDTVVGAFSALGILGGLPSVPEDVYLQMWDRAWTWVVFFHTYQDHLLGLPGKNEVYSTFLQLIVYFQAHGCAALLKSTPGIRSVVGTAWDIFISCENHDGLRNVSFFLIFDMDYLCRLGYWEEYLEGTDGGLEHLAVILMQHLDHAIVDATTPMSPKSVILFEGALTFMVGVQELDGVRSPLGASLVHRGIVRALTIGIRSLNLVVADHDKGPVLIAATLNLLGQRVTTPPGRQRMSESLQAGLLHAAVHIASTNLGDDSIEQTLNYFLREALPGYMVYHSILSHRVKQNINLRQYVSKQ
ncbi:hypothetical protein B0H11DRAFT_2036507 [Mycena galericulata]|nr:hypothetical protein B0H11DRAFT_2036507 [Mycena galericulata]